jgi:hypothetical protein
MKRKIPKFKNEKEARDFWDKNSPADFESELKPTSEIVFVKPQKETLTLRMDRKDINELKHVGEERRIPPSTLARVWIVEKLRESHAHSHK